MDRRHTAKLPITPLTPSPVIRTPLQTPSTLTSSSTRTLVSDSGTSNDESRLSAIFDIHDVLIKHGSEAANLPFCNIVSIGGQSAGKSSVLSMISKMPLWTASKTATHGPTQIHSRYKPSHLFKATIQIEYAHPARGMPKRVQFNKVEITSKEKLADMLRMAGDEARRSVDGSIPIRGLELLLGMSVAEREKGKDQWDRFTENIVIVHVSGRLMSDVSIVDLPGLMSGTYEDLIKAMVSKEISKKENLILLCISGGGSDPSMSALEVALTRKYDPKGSRTMGFITQADKIGDPSDSSITDLITRSNPDWTWHPLHGWWPLRLKSAKEHSDKISDSVLHLTQQAFFDTKEWKFVQEKCGRSFGIEETRTKLYGVFAEMVQQNVHDLQRLMKEQTDRLTTSISELPAEIHNPVGMLHGQILDLDRKLHLEILQGKEYTGKLSSLQKDLSASIFKSLPVFLPYREDATSSTELYTDLKLNSMWCEDIDMLSSGEPVHIDAVHAILDKYTCQRSFHCDLRPARLHYLKIHAGKWGGLCDLHINKVWEVINEAMMSVCKDVFYTTPSLSGKIRDILAEHQTTYRERAMDLASRLVRRENDDPNQIDIHSGIPGRLFREVHDHLTKEYAKLNPDTTLAYPLKPLSEEEKQRCLAIMASMTVNLFRGAIRVSDIVGRETQGLVIEYLDSVVVALREQLGLERVEQPVLVRVQGDLEPDRQVVKKRAELAKRKRELEDVGERLKAIRDL